MKNVWFFGSSYIIPNVDTVVLGGTTQKGNWDTSVSLQDTETILSRIGEVFPALTSAPIVSLVRRYFPYALQYSTVLMIFLWLCSVL